MKFDWDTFLARLIEIFVLFCVPMLILFCTGCTLHVLEVPIEEETCSNELLYCSYYDYSGINSKYIFEQDLYKYDIIECRCYDVLY